MRKRETFAYACEAYSRIAAKRPAERAALVEELAKGPMPNEERVNGEEYLAILREAAVVRNGWKVIISRCAPATRRVMPAA